MVNLRVMTFLITILLLISVTYIPSEGYMQKVSHDICFYNGCPSVKIRNNLTGETVLVVLKGVYETINSDMLNASIQDRVLTFNNLVRIIRNLKYVSCFQCGARHIESYVQSVWIDDKAYNLSFKNLKWSVYSQELSYNVNRYVIKPSGLNSELVKDIEVLVDILPEDLAIDIGDSSIFLEDNSVKIGIIVDRWNWIYGENLIKKINEEYGLNLSLSLTINIELIFNPENPNYEIYKANVFRRVYGFGESFTPALNKDIIFSGGTTPGIINIDSFAVHLLGFGYIVNGQIKKVNVVNIAIITKNSMELYISLKPYRNTKIIYDPIIQPLVREAMPMPLVYEEHISTANSFSTKSTREAGCKICGVVTEESKPHINLINPNDFYIPIEYNSVLGLITSILIVLLAIALAYAKINFND